MSVSESERAGSVSPEDLGQRLRVARDSGRPIAPVRDLLGSPDIEKAYRVQEAVTMADLTSGRRLVGRKVGLTSKSVQRQLGVDEPDYGMLFADMNCDEHEPIDTQKLIAPRIEAEIAFVLKGPLDRPHPTMAEVIDAVGYVLPALEIVDSRIVDWNITIHDTIADNASSGLFVVGATPVSLSHCDLGRAGMVLEVDGDPVSFGAGAACLGHPLSALRWLATKMQLVGRPLGRGDVVLSGALGPMVPVVPGKCYEARISGLGTVRASFAAKEHLS